MKETKKKDNSSHKIVIIKKAVKEKLNGFTKIIKKVYKNSPKWYRDLSNEEENKKRTTEETLQ